MEKPDDQLSLDQVLANMAWIRRLAHRLVGDAAERDDVVQEVWLEAGRTSPEILLRLGTAARLRGQPVTTNVVITSSAGF